MVHSLAWICIFVRMYEITFIRVTVFIFNLYTDGVDTTIKEMFLIHKVRIFTI